MIRDANVLRRFEGELSRGEGPLPYSKSLRIFEWLWEEAIALKALPLKDPLEGIEVDIKMAKILNTCLKGSYQR